MRKKPKLDWDSRLWWVTEIDIASFPMRRFFFSLTELGIAGLSWFFTRLAICHKFYKSWLAVIGVALAAKSSCNINDQELLTSGNKPKFSTVKGRVTYLACLFHVHPNFPKKGVWYFWQLWMRWLFFTCFERVTGLIILSGESLTGSLPEVIFFLPPYFNDFGPIFLRIILLWWQKG